MIVQLKVILQIFVKLTSDTFVKQVYGILGLLIAHLLIVFSPDFYSVLGGNGCEQNFARFGADSDLKLGALSQAEFRQNVLGPYFSLDKK